MRASRRFFTVIGLVTLCWQSGTRADLEIRQIAGQAEVGTVEIHNVGAGTFDPKIWRAGTLNIVPDVRSPMITPRLDGVWRNIYAPSAVEIPGGWRLFYGAWDGAHSGNDRIYSVTTSDFLNFDDWRTVIEHGPFIHVCNVSAVRVPDGDFHMLCTAYPVGPNLNKPVAFRVPKQSPPAPSPMTAAQSSAAAIEATKDALITLDGYEPFEAADINGINVLFFEDGVYRMYFGDFKNFGHVRRASSQDGKHFRYDGECLPAALMVNDVKKFTPGGQPCYLMGLHRNRNKLWYALSDDGMKFEPQRELATSLGAADRYIVAVGWVTQGERLLGFVYGAGAVPGLNRNRLFARWLQKTIVFTDAQGRRHVPTAALGPDRCLLSIGDGKELTGHLQILAEDGKTAVGTPIPVKLTSGAVYQIVRDTE